MVFVFEGRNNEASVIFDGNSLTDEQKARAIAVESLPQPQPLAGKVGILKARRDTGEVWYDYVDRPQAELEQQVATLQQENVTMMEALAALYEQISGGVVA